MSFASEKFLCLCLTNLFFTNDKAVLQQKHLLNEISAILLTFLRKVHSAYKDHPTLLKFIANAFSQALQIASKVNRADLKLPLQTSVED